MSILKRFFRLFKLQFVGKLKQIDIQEGDVMSLESKLREFKEQEKLMSGTLAEKDDKIQAASS